MLIHCTQVTYQERNQNYQTFEHIKTNGIRPNVSFVASVFQTVNIISE